MKSELSDKPSCFGYPPQGDTPATDAFAQSTHVNRPAGDFVVLQGVTGSSLQGASVPINHLLLPNGTSQADFKIPRGCAEGAGIA